MDPHNKKVVYKHQHHHHHHHTSADRRRINPVFAAVLFFLTSTYIMMVFQLSVEFQKEAAVEAVVLDDVFFGILPQLQDSEWLIEALINLGLVCTLVRVWVLNQTKKQRERAYCHAFTCGAVVYLLRAVVLFVTPLPNPYPNCVSGLVAHDPFMWNALLVVLRIHRTCHDVLFSGHSMSLSLYVCVFAWYVKRTWETVAVAAYASITAVLIVSSHYHYTVDVILGVFITSTTFALLYERHIPWILPSVLYHHYLPEGSPQQTSLPASSSSSCILADSNEMC